MHRESGARRRYGWLLQPIFLALLGAGVASGESLRLKTRNLSPPRDLADRFAAPIKRRSFSRSHYLLQFEGRPGREQIRELARRAAAPTGSVPGFGLIVAAADGLSLEGLNVRWAGRLRAEDKLSPALARIENPSQAGFIVEFHPDVEMEEARAMVREHGLRLVAHPDMMPHQLLATGHSGQAVRLTDWDEVAYVFPASEDLLEGRRVEACAGALSEFGFFGQYAKVGAGWPAGSQGFEVGYHVGALTPKLPGDTVRAEILRALEEWARYANLRFRPETNPAAARTISIHFASGAHGDPYPFDGPGKILAHTFYPAPPNPEPIAGDMHLDAEEGWNAGGNVDLFSAALHEAGHALGLGHLDRPGSVMYPYYRKVAKLGAEDIAEIRELYGASTESDEPPIEEPARPSLTLTLTVVQPPGVTKAPSIAVYGATANGVGEVEVSWTSSRGPSGAVRGPAGWAISVPLLQGENGVTITARDGAGRTASRSFTVTREEEAAKTLDRVIPGLRITRPTSTIIQTSEAFLTLRGKADDNIGVTAVTWTTSGGASGNAVGTVQWTASNVPLLKGDNTIVIRAYDAAGNMGWRSLTVVRR
ncbi:MAG: matrixin family metalloprotease [Bryobacteraceae bacterium]